VMMKVISNLITYRHSFPYSNPLEDEDDECVIQISRTLRPTDIDDYITVEVDGLMDLYLSIDEAKILAAEIMSAAEYVGGKSNE